MAGKRFIVFYCPSIKAQPFGCFTALRRLSCFLQLASLPPSVPLLVCCKASLRTKAIAIALRHPAALHIAGATCAPARSYQFSAAAQSPHAFALPALSVVEGQANASLLRFACF
jgi:hypothetical protein